MKIPRGIRNNNPLNIRKNNTNWLGATTGLDTEFVTFGLMEYGIRAALIILRTYLQRETALTPAKVIERWAPNTENATSKYIKAVALETGLKMNQLLFWHQRDRVCQLMHGMAIVENGWAWEYKFPLEDFQHEYDRLTNIQ